VVDPGVGTERKALAVKTENFYFVVPDNSLLWETLMQQTIIEIRQIHIPPHASRTFHGRDVFAKAAVNIDLGNFNDVGEKIKEIEKLELYQNQREGIIVRIDRFGNIVTNLAKLDKDKYSIQTVGRKFVMNFCPDYDSANEGELFLIEGSCNTLEISLKNGNAGDKLNVKVGDNNNILKSLITGFPSP
jgi:S-adenosylmethionine hydrolase